MVPVSVQVVAADACDPSPRCRIDGVSVNGPHGPDWQLRGDLLVDLRAVKMTTGSERIYTLDLVCTDAAGLSGWGRENVRVPKSQGNGPKKP
jgi:hypothetical protein